MPTKTRVLVTCDGCNYRADFEFASIAIIAAEMHVGLGPTHKICYEGIDWLNVYDKTGTLYSQVALTKGVQYPTEINVKTVGENKRHRALLVDRFHHQRMGASMVMIHDPHYLIVSEDACSVCGEHPYACDCEGGPR